MQETLQGLPSKKAKVRTGVLDVELALATAGLAQEAADLDAGGAQAEQLLLQPAASGGSVAAYK